MMTYHGLWKSKLTSISRIITLLPFVYKKFFPLGSPFKIVGFPLTVCGEVANMCPVNINEAHSNEVSNHAE